MIQFLFALVVLVSFTACGRARTSLANQKAAPALAAAHAPVVATSASPTAVGPTAGEPVEQCGQYASPVAYKVCIYKTPGSHNSDVLYFLHGLTGDEHGWLNGPAYKQARALWNKSGQEAPTVIGVSFGPQWLLTENTTGAGSGLYPVFVSAVMPTIEAGLGQWHGRRLLLGESMGGFNATELFLKNGALFDRVMLACPALATLTPFSSAADVNAYTLRTKAKAPYVSLLVNLMHYFFQTQDAWAAASPFDLAEKNLSAASPKLHVSCGDQDEFGFFEGAKAFADLAKSKGVDTIWALLHGGHCTVDPQAVADFLIPLAH